MQLTLSATDIRLIILKEEECMLPRRMSELLHDLLPEPIFKARRQEDNGLVFIEFTSQDVETLNRLGIKVDNLGRH